MSARTTVYRVRLALRGGRETVRLPQGARVVSAQTRDGTPDQVDVWAEVDPNAPAVDVAVWVVGTGWPEAPPSGAHYVDTVQLNHGALVLHVYAEDTEQSA